MNEEVNHPVLKGVSAVVLTFLGLSLTEWAQLAGLLLSVHSSIYCLCLIAEWLVKRIVRPLARHYAWTRIIRLFPPTDRGDL